MCAIERCDQRLNHTHSAVKGAGIAPRFQVVGFADMPITKLGSLVKMGADVDDVFDLFPICFWVKLEFRREIEIVRRGVNRVDTENQQRLDLAGVHVGAEFAQRIEMIHGARFHRLGVIERLSNIPKRGIDLVHQRVNFGRLLLARNDKTPALMLKKILRHHAEPLLAPRWWGRVGKGRPYEPQLDINNFSRQRAGKNLHFGSAQRQAMIRGRTRDAWRGLNNIEPIHFHFREYLIGQWVGPVLAQLAPAGKLSRVPDVAWSASEEIRIERENDVGLFREVNRVDVASKG